MFKLLTLSITLLFVTGFAYGQQQEDTCADKLPFFHAQLGENWPLAGISSKTSPAFTMAVKQKRDLNTGEVQYKPGRKYSIKVTANKKLKIKEMYVSAEKIAGDENCEVGAFKSYTKPKKASALSSDCQTYMVFKSNKRKGSKKVTGKWISPKTMGCSQVSLRLTLVANDGKIYNDEIENDQIVDPEQLKHNTLTLLFTQKQKN